MNSKINAILNLNRQELQNRTPLSASWHSTYSHSAYIFLGNVNVDLSEGDLICVCSQFGEVVDCVVIRDQDGNSRGCAFVAFEDQRSTVLAIDNLNGVKVAGRPLHVDHAHRYVRHKRKFARDEQGNKVRPETEEQWDAPENDEDYDTRRKLIWNDELYSTLPVSNPLPESSSKLTRGFTQEPKTSFAEANIKTEEQKSNNATSAQDEKILNWIEQRKRQRKAQQLSAPNQPATKRR